MASRKALILTDDLTGQCCLELEGFFRNRSASPVICQKSALAAVDPGAQLGHSIQRHQPDLLIAILTGSKSTKLASRLSPILEKGIPVLAITDSRDLGSLPTLEKRAPVDFITLPLDAGEVHLRVGRLLGPARMIASPTANHIIGSCPAFRTEIDKIPRIAATDARILIWGETGTGKEVCARAVHYQSPRHDKPFVPVNCGAMPENLVENELFGHERGAYTGAESSQQGLVGEAEGGTLFLDEIGCMPGKAQTKLLRLLQEKEYRPLGSSRTRQADVRIITATNTDLEEAVSRGDFRMDLFFRLNVVPLNLPPLRERLEDVPLLAEHFLSRYTTEYHSGELRLSAEALCALSLHDWPGNVRELEHVIERAVVLATGPVIGADIVRQGERRQQLESFKIAKARAVKAFEVRYLQGLLHAFNGNITRAAAAAHKDRRAFFELIRKHQIDACRFKSSR